MKKIAVIVVLILILGISTSAFALPSLQVYIKGGVAGDRDGDEDTWFMDCFFPGNYQLVVVGSYGPNDTAITDAKVLVTVPQNQTGSIGGLGASSIRYDTLSFLPVPEPKPKLWHYPLNKPGLFDYYTFDIGSFAANVGTLNDYNADGGTITPKYNAVGEEKTFTISISGYEYCHFDAYAKFNNDSNDWRANRGSHDASGHHYTPEPATLLLMGTGLAGFGFLRRKKNG